MIDYESTVNKNEKESDNENKGSETNNYLIIYDDEDLRED